MFLWKEVLHEIQLAENALNTLQLEIASFLHPPLPPSQHDRPRRAIPLAAVAVGAIGLIGTGVVMGSDDWSARNFWYLSIQRKCQCHQPYVSHDRELGR